jgi:peptide/nickel transport system permease protein
MTRTTMLEVIRQDYIRTARAKGVSEGVVIRKHALKNCLIPLTTVTVPCWPTCSPARLCGDDIPINGMGIYLMSGSSIGITPSQRIRRFISMLICIVNLLNDIAFASSTRVSGRSLWSRGKSEKTNKRMAQAAICES